MGKLFRYLIFIGCLSGIWGRQILGDSISLEKQKKNNVTDSPNKTYFPTERIDNEKLREDILRFQGRRKYQTFKQKTEKSKSRGLSAFEEPPSKVRKRNFFPSYLNKGFNIYRYAESAKKYLVPPYSQELYPAKNFNRKPFHNNNLDIYNISTKDKNLRSPLFYKKNNSTFNQSHLGEASEIIKIFQSYPHEGRNTRFHYPRYNSKICNSCNNVPWIPLIKIPHSYRQERNQKFEVHKPNSNINLNPAPSIPTRDFLLPPIPVLPSTQFILDKTISSSFGLPVGNIPMSHGMLAPLNHLTSKFNRYGANSIDYSHSLSYFTPQNIISNNNAFPELSPVPIVPIYDSGQFHAGSFFDVPITKLLPPTTKTLAVSNVILTFSEGSSGNLDLSNHENSGASFDSDTGAIVDLHPPPPPIQSVQNLLNHPQSSQNPHQVESFKTDGLEIIKSVPIAEFLSSDNYAPPPSSQHLSQNFQPSSYSQNSLSSDKNHNNYQNTGSSQPPPSQHLSQNFQPSSYSQNSLLSDKNHNNYPNIDSSQPPPSQFPLQNFQSSSYSQNPLLSDQNHNHNHNQNLDFSENSSERNGDKLIKDNPSNYLVPPPLDHFYNSSLNEVFPPYPPKETENTFQGPLHASPSETNTLAVSPTLSWIFSDHHANVNPTPHPLLAESQAIASVVNSQLYPELSKPFPIASSEIQNFDGPKAKKIQIIIPYTTKNKNEVDHNEVENVSYESLSTKKLIQQSNITNDLIFTTSIPLTSEIFSSKNVSSEQQEIFTQTENPFNYRTIQAKDEEEENNEDNTYLSETQHIIASNVRQLLLNEAEKVNFDQNFSLQKNIDNWTALEYSNHKVYDSKQPQKIITQALAVTTIPGTSISHLLLPSKKIPSEYFATKASPVYEDTPNFLYEIINSTVNSSPFTAKPYASTNLYSPLTTVTKEISKDYYQPSESQSVTTINYNNPEKNYTVVGKSRISTWGKINENLLIPSGKTTARKFEETTLSIFKNKHPLDSTKHEKVEVVTPVYWTNFTSNSYRRTTRHLTTVVQSTSTDNPKTKNQRPTIFPFISRLRTTLLKTVNSTKLEKVSNCKNFKEISNNITRCDNKTEGEKQGNSENMNKTITVHETRSNFNFSPVVVASNFLRNVSSEEVIKLLKTNKSEEFSINDIFPFRNHELPWEANSLNASNLSYQNEKQRKSLIKQKKLGKPKIAS